nr:MAG TPA: hypothetical protein [Crassvirales sp.]
MANEYNDLYTESNDEYEQYKASVADKSAGKETQDLKPSDEKQPN